eukprot:GEMP01011678.1.p1 GENE.GEMP01011678.1~~GEMP01011678.1.p1  ORF type:complete len:876 (+),score=279.42 GEMP01011678.1:52-2679(+)
MGVKKKVGKNRMDKYYQMAKDQGYRARSAFKLVQLAKKFDFLSKSTVCIDLCGAPGGWSQVAHKHMPSKSLIMCVDLVPIKPIYGVVAIQADITTPKCRSVLKKQMGGKLADVVLNDGAPNVGTSWAHDAYSQAELTLHACKLASEFLRPGGTFVTKVFRSSDYNNLLYVFQQLFNKVEATKPQASRDVSAEIFVICTGYKSPKLDPRLFEPKWVFMEARDQAEEQRKKAGASLADVVKYSTKRRRRGYDEGDDYRTITAIEFIKASNPVDSVVSHNKIIFDEASAEISKNPLTDSEILECCKDLKVLGKNDLGKLIKWRARLRREHEKDQKKEKKDKKKDSRDEKKDGKDAENGDKSSEEDEDMGKLQDMVAKVAQEERRESKKARELKKKQERRKKMSMGSHFNTGEEQDLFSGASKFAKTLEEEDAPFLCSSDEDGDGSDEEEVQQPEAESDTDRIARMEVEQILAFRASKEKSKESKQKDLKKKKETRRELRAKEWSGEIQQVGHDTDARAQSEYAKHNALSSDEDDDDDDDEPMPPAEAPKENDWKDEMKAERWFAQGIFANVEQKDDVHSSDGDGDISEMDEKDIVQLPLTDKQRRQKMRAKNRKKSERKKAWEVDEFGGEAVDEEKEKHEKVEVVPAFTPAEGALCATPPSAMTAPTDVREKAEIQALGSLMIRKKSRMDIIDAAYNRFVFEDIPDQLPEWFVEEENRFNKPELPISKELMEQFNAKLREINARPIRKVAEAQARKKKRLTQRMDKLRKEAKAMAENHDMSAGAKARNMERMMRKAKGEDKRTNKTMFIKKGGGGTDVGKKGAKLGKNVKTKVVDKRLKADKRGLKIAAKKNKKKGLKKKPNKSVKKIKGKKGSSRRR